MPDYFLSDVHLRLDEPDRGERLALLVDRLGPDDRLTIVGDLCDFWFGSRQWRADPMTCDGLRSLAEFRDRGGSTTVLAGNHDTWLGPFYERTIGARFVPDALDLEAQGLRIHLAHGHRLWARVAWKAPLKSRAFFEAFRRVPSVLADTLGERLKKANAKDQDAFDRLGQERYRTFADAMAGRCDVVILGHVHLPLDVSTLGPRLIILGGWHSRSCHAVLDDRGLAHVVEPARAGFPA